MPILQIATTYYSYLEIIPELQRLKKSYILTADLLHTTEVFMEETRGSSL